MASEWQEEGRLPLSFDPGTPLLHGFRLRLAIKHCGVSHGSATC